MDSEISHETFFYAKQGKFPPPLALPSATFAPQYQLAQGVVHPYTDSLWRCIDASSSIA
jgi:hypothetical protein